MLDKNLNISLFEYDIAWCDKQKNLNNVQKALEAMPHGVDLVILPEMFTTGFVVDKETAVKLAERNTQNTINTIQQFANKHNVAICGSFLANTASQLYNRAFFIEPNGDETFYDKRHLFRMGGETETFNQGVTFAPVIRFRGWNIKIVICYDCLLGKGIYFGYTLIPFFCGRWILIPTFACTKNNGSGIRFSG